MPMMIFPARTGKTPALDQVKIGLSWCFFLDKIDWID
jgi:hypothetical protein